MKLYDTSRPARPGDTFGAIGKVIAVVFFFGMFLTHCN